MHGIMLIILIYTYSKTVTLVCKNTKHIRRHLYRHICFWLDYKVANLFYSPCRLGPRRVAVFDTNVVWTRLVLSCRDCVRLTQPSNQIAQNRVTANADAGLHPANTLLVDTAYRFEVLCVLFANRADASKHRPAKWASYNNSLRGPNRTAIFAT